MLTAKQVKKKGKYIEMCMT
uniref:Uncharacterized protein n=1 Tax=Rhizophora mucronata TaxID=61149 RepID=A0A2P2Q244_RHIMU